MEFKTIHKTEAQMNADRANFYFANRALNSHEICHASDFQKVVPELTWEQSKALAAMMKSILQGYRAEAEKCTDGGKAGEIIFS